MKSMAQANRLVLVAIIGQAIAYGLAIFVARRLTIAGFEAYVIASAIFILLATLAPLGAEKYTLRQLPPLLAAGDRARAHGLLRFGVRRTMLTATIAAILVATWAAVTREGQTQAAIIVTCLSLPGGAVVHYGLDLLTAAGRPLRALAVFRILVPATALALLVLAALFGIALDAPLAVASWGLAWLVALAVMVAALARVLAPVRAAPLVADLPKWRAEAQPFLVYRLALSLLGQSGVVALDLSGASGTEIGAYAAAMATVGMAAVLATATNRAYGRELALLLEAVDSAGVAALHRQRLCWLLAPLAGFVIAALAFPGAVLALFRPEFAAAGAVPLRLLALTTAVTVALALAPTQLKFQRRNRAIYTVMAVAAGAQLVLLAVLVPRLGATGAALAYALSMGGSYVTFALLARRVAPA